MATVKSIEFDDHGNPENVTVRMTAEEAAYIAKFTGQQTADTANEVMKTGCAANSALYDTMTGDLFNRFYDGGVDEWVRDVF